MPPITRSGRRGRRGGATNEPPRVQAQVEAAQEEAVIMPAVQQNVQAVVAPPPTIPVYTPPNVDQVFEYFKLCTLRFSALHIRELRA